MAKQIKSSDIFEGDIFENVRQSAIKTIDVLDKMNAEMKMTAQVMKKELGSLKLDSLSSIKELIKLTEKANQINKESIAINKAREQAISTKTRAEIEALAVEKQKQQTAQETIKTEREQLKLTRDLERAEKQKAQQDEKAKKNAQDQNNAYKQLERNTRELKNQSKTLGAELRQLEANNQRGTKEWYETSRALAEVTKKAREGDKALKDIDKSVGDNFRNVGNYEGAVNKLSRGLGALGLAFGISDVVRSAGTTIVDFDQKIADLVAITGASGSDLEFFKTQAIELGKGVKGGASEVIEAYKLIGSAKPELLSNAEALDAVTQSAITLSQASGMTLPESASALTDAMNQFGADASDATTFIDALANGALFGSAEIGQVTESMLKFGAIAKTSNVSVQESVGLIEALAERGLKGAEAGTALRNVMLKLSAPDALPKEAKDMLEGLGISFEKLQDTSIPFSERLAELKPLLTDNTALVKTFGTENAVSATNLIASTDRIKELTDSMYTQGTASKQAEDRTQTLSFALNQLKESWNALILSFSEGSGASSLLTSFISFLAENLGTIVSVIGKAVVAWGAYRTILLAVQAKQYIFNGGLKQTIVGMTDVFKSTKKAGEGAESMGKSVGNAGRTLGAIPWVAIIGAVIELATAFYDVASGAKAAREASADAEKTIADAEEKASTRSEERQKQLRLELAQRMRLKNEATDQKKAEAEFLIEQEKLLSKTKKAIDSDIKSVRERKDAFLEQKQIIESALSSSVNKQISSTTMAGEKLEETFKKMGIQTEGLKNWSGSFETNLVNAELIKLQGRIDATSEKITIYKGELDQTDEALKDATSSLKINSNAQEDNTGKINAKIPKMKEYKLQLAEVNEYLTKQNELLAKIDEIESRKTIDAKQQEIDIKLSNDIAYAKESGEVQVDALERLIDEKFKLEKDAILQQQQEKLSLIEQQYTEQSIKERDELIKKRDELLAQEGISEEAKKTIREDYDKQFAQIEMNDLQRNADLELEKIIIADETNQQLVELDKSKNDEINKVNDELFDAQIEHYDNLKDKSKETNDEIVQNDKETAQRRREFFQLATDYFVKQSEKRIQQIDKEIASAEKQSDILRELAVNGNINAKESLAEQQRIINEANARKEKEQRKQQRLQLLNTAFATYQGKVESGSKNPLAETIRDVSLLRAFIDTIPAFESGTEDTGANGRGVDGKGGFHAILHPNERVIPKSMNEKIGSLSNEQLTKIAMEYQNGRMMKSNDQIGSSMDTAILINKLDELTETIKMKPETNIEIGEITQSMMEIVRSTKKGNTTTYNRYKIRK